MAWDSTKNSTNLVESADWNAMVIDQKDRPRSFVKVVAASNSISQKADYICDGTADQTEINSAITACTNGGTVILLDGTFTCSGAINFSSGVELKGQGSGTIVQFTSGSGYYPITNNTNTAIRDMYIKIGISPADGWALRLNSSNCTIEEIIFEQTAGSSDGFLMSENQISYLTVKNCTFKKSGAGSVGGVIITEFYYSNFIGNRVLNSIAFMGNPDDDGLYYSTVTDNYCTGSLRLVYGANNSKYNTIKGNYSNTLVIDSGTNNNAIVGNTVLTSASIAGSNQTFSDNSIGTTLTTGSDNLTNSTISGNTTGGAFTWDLNGTGYHNAVVGNYFNSIVMSHANGDSIFINNATSTSGASGGTQYWSCSGYKFIPKENASDCVYVSGTPDELAWQGLGAFGGGLEARGSVNFVCPVNLPHGAVVTGAIVYGEDTSDTWILRRILLSNTATSDDMANATFDTEDTSISNATIDNSTYSYVFVTGTVASGNQIDGARVTYTI